MHSNFEKYLMHSVKSSKCKRKNFTLIFTAVAYLIIFKIEFKHAHTLPKILITLLNLLTGKNNFLRHFYYRKYKSYYMNDLYMSTYTIEKR